MLVIRNENFDMLCNGNYKKHTFLHYGREENIITCIRQSPSHQSHWCATIPVTLQKLQFSTPLKHILLVDDYCYFNILYKHVAVCIRVQLHFFTFLQHPQIIFTIQFYFNLLLWAECSMETGRKPVWIYSSITSRCDHHLQLVGFIIIPGVSKKQVDTFE